MLSYLPHVQYGKEKKETRLSYLLHISFLIQYGKGKKETGSSASASAETKKPNLLINSDVMNPLFVFLLLVFG